MNEALYLHIYNKQNQIEAVPSNEEIAQWAMNLMNLLYPERLTTPDYSVNEIKRLFVKLEDELVRLLNSTKACEDCENEAVAVNFFKELPELYRKNEIVDVTKI